jgi:hypothetical protein
MLLAYCGPIGGRSRKVPQLGRILTAWRAHPETMTCGDGRWFGDA